MSVQKLIGLSAAAFLVSAFHKRRQSLTFEHFITLPDQELPPLSIVVAAKDEGLTIGPALESLLDLEYPELEVILVEDRSVDDTYQVALECQQRHPRGHRLVIERCKELPEGWLGKVHGLHLGARKARHPLILFTDADVHFAPESLKRAVSIQQVLSCDHLVAAPQIDARGFWEPLLTAYFLIMFAVRFQPSQVHTRKKSYVGIGAFNMLTRQTLERCHYLEPLRLQITDDVHLGRLVKSLGMSQYCVIAEDQIRVRWFEGLLGCVRGLEKNAYAGLNYSLPFAVLVLLSLLGTALAPALMALTGKATWAGLYLLFLFLTGLTVPPSCRLPRWVGLFFPVAAGVLAYTFGRSVWLTEKQDGVRWRGTYYSLAELRKEHWRFLREKAPL